MVVFVKGLVLGFTIAAAIGPIGILCIQRTLSNGKLNGFLSGLGAATADGLYAAIAAFGLTLMSQTLIDNKIFIQILGGALLLYIGIKIFLSKTEVHVDEKTNVIVLTSAYVSTLFLTIANPMTIISFIAAFAAIGTIGTNSDALLFVASIFLGSAIWWAILSSLVGHWRERLRAHVDFVNKASAILIICFGSFSLIMGVLSMNV